VREDRSVPFFFLRVSHLPLFQNPLRAGNFPAPGESQANKMVLFFVTS
jgi:hypothetical protein